MRTTFVLLAAIASSGAGAQERPPADTLPVAAAKALASSLDAAKSFSRHHWRDTPPWNSDGTLNAYVEIARGDQRKWEFNMARNARAIDRVMPNEIGGYPVNYGFVPQTVSYDGDPFDALVLGPALPDGALARGVVVGLMNTEDENGMDAKVVLSPVGPDNRAVYELTAGERARIGGFFERYKQWEAGKFSRVPGWGTVTDGEAFVRVTHSFFRQCRTIRTADCTVSR
jgi:inorganic pyrophosphatase